MYALLGIVLFCALRQSLCQHNGFCTDSKGQNACRLLADCQLAITQIESGSFPRVCGSEGTRLLVCCSDASSQSFTQTTTTQSTTITTTTRTTAADSTTAISPTTATFMKVRRNTGDISRTKCKHYSKAYEKDVQGQGLFQGRQCPFKKEDINIDHHRVLSDELPHVVAIGVGAKSHTWLCTGSLISENFVLTSATCSITLYHYSNVRDNLVRVGFYNQLNTSNVQFRSIIAQYNHPQFGYTELHDIALLKLNEDVHFNTYARPACLYTEKSVPEKYGVVSTWEKEKIENGLTKLILEYIDTPTCYNSSFLINDRNFSLEILDNYMICFGDKIGPLNFCLEPSSSNLQIVLPDSPDQKCMYAIVGVTTIINELCWEIDGKQKLYVFTRISAYIKWIEDTVWPN